MKKITLLMIIGCYLGGLSLFAQPFQYAEDNPIELGKVNWLRNYDEAIHQSQTTGKDLFVLFQEVPGCANCTKYGREILSHPLVIEAIESEFVPLAIYNNVKGHDREVLLQFREPTWNNPVVRIINHEGSDVTQRVGDFRSKAAVLEAMITALQQKNRATPEYINLLHQEWAAEEGGSEEAYLSMFCFWTGEKEIARMEGVLATEAGYMHGREVVKVSYDQSITDLNKISKNAAKVNCGDALYTNQKITGGVPTKKTGKYRKDKEDKYYLRHTDYQYVPMTDLQKSKVNSAIGQRKNPNEYLSPRQLSWLDHNSKKKSYVASDFIESWWEGLM